MTPNLLLALPILRSVLSPHLLQSDRFLVPVRTLIQALEHSENFRFSCFLSGFALEAINSAAPDVPRQLAQLHQLGRLEILSGLFFEPKLSLLTDNEVSDQLRLTSDFWSELGVNNLCGAWLPELSWHQALGEALVENGYRYLVLDRTLIGSRTDSRDTFSPILHEHQGYPLVLLPDTGLEPFTPESFVEEFPENIAEEADLQTAEYRLLVLTSLLTPKKQLPDSYGAEGQVSLLERFTNRLTQCQDLTTVLCREAAELYLDGCSVEEELSFVEPEVCISAPETADTAAIRLNHRMADLRRQLEPLPSYIEEHPHIYANRERLKRACRWFLRSQYRPPPVTAASVGGEYLSRREAYQSLLHAQVEIDKIKHPEIDPVDGWVLKELIDYDEEQDEEVIIDTPFIRLYFKPSRGGSLVEFDYKPRKLNLLNTADQEQENFSFTGSLIQEEELETPGQRKKNSCAPPLEPAKTTILRHSPDLVVTRFVQPIRTLVPLGEDSFSAELFKTFTIKAGLGAHLQNSTTGFALEYWLESEAKPPENVLFALEWTFMLPSANPDGLSARPLFCVGGEAESTHSLAEPLRLSTDSVPGGAYGIRLIDGLEGYIIELRSAKALRLLEVVPLKGESDHVSKVDADLPDYGGSLVRFVSTAAELFGDQRSNTLFLSIP